MGWFKGKKAEMKTQVVEDPYKIAVSSPLSSYLATQVGKGLPRYEDQLYEPMDTSAYSKFLSIEPGEWYTKAIQEPTLKAAREEVPFIEEGWAGALRGSGRFRDVEDYWSDVSETLGEGRYQAELQIPQAQFGMAQAYSQQRTQQLQLEYIDWMKSLPEMNPTLDKALQFLAGPSGRDVITYQTAGKGGKGGLLGGTLGMIVGALLALPTGGMSVLGGAALGGAIGGGAGSLFN